MSSVKSRYRKKKMLEGVGLDMQVHDAIDHEYLELCPVFLKGGPLEASQHFCDTAGPSVVTNNKSGISALHHF